MTISLRDYLAAHASEADVERWREWESRATTVKGLCEWTEDEATVVVGGSYKRSAEEARYAFADAMLQARKGKTPQAVAAGVVTAEETPGQWHLPSRDVLNAMYQHKEEIGGFASDNHWSVSEYNSSYNVWIQYFYNGYQYPSRKDGNRRVRAVRALPHNSAVTDKTFACDGVTYQAYWRDLPGIMTWGEAVQWCEQLNREDV